MEMKKEWVKPETKVQMFVPNEYVAACECVGGTMNWYPADTVENGFTYGEMMNEDTPVTCNCTTPVTDRSSVRSGYYMENSYVNNIIGGLMDWINPDQVVTRLNKYEGKLVTASDGSTHVVANLS